MKDIVEINRKEIVVDAVLEELDNVTDYISEYLAEIGCSTPMEIKICIACEEIFVNIASYAYAPDSGIAEIGVIISEDPLEVAIVFADSGVPYDPLAKEDPDITLSADERPIGGLGIFMVKKTMDDIRYEFRNGMNILRIEKRI